MNTNDAEFATSVAIRAAYQASRITAEAAAAAKVAAAKAAAAADAAKAAFEAVYDAYTTAADTADDVAAANSEYSPYTDFLVALGPTGHASALYGDGSGFAVFVLEHGENGDEDGYEIAYACGLTQAPHDYDHADTAEEAWETVQEVRPVSWSSLERPPR